MGQLNFQTPLHAELARVAAAATPRVMQSPSNWKVMYTPCELELKMEKWKVHNRTARDTEQEIERERESAIESIVGFRMSKLSRSLAYLSDTSSAIARCAMIHAEFGDSETETETENKFTQVLLKHKQHIGFSTGFFCCFVDLAA